MANKLLLLCGVSGVGKSSIIKELKKLDSKIVYISPYTSRQLREYEKDKINVLKESIIEHPEKFLIINKIYGNLYATPKKEIFDAIQKGNIPLLDFPLEKVEELKKRFEGEIYCAYILPPSIEILKKRLEDERDSREERYKLAKQELEKINTQRDKNINLYIINEENRARECAQKILLEYGKLIK